MVVVFIGGFVDIVKEGVIGYYMGVMDVDIFFLVDVDVMVEMCVVVVVDYGISFYIKMFFMCIF